MLVDASALLVTETVYAIEERREHYSAVKRRPYISIATMLSVGTKIKYFKRLLFLLLFVISGVFDVFFFDNSKRRVYTYQCTFINYMWNFCIGG